MEAVVLDPLGTIQTLHVELVEFCVLQGLAHLGLGSGTGSGLAGSQTT